MGRDPQEEVITILKELQKQISYLEKKIDLLSKGPSDRKLSKSRNYSSSSSSRSSAGARPSLGGSRYKNKHESRYRDKESSVSKWYEKKRGDDLSPGAKKKRAYKNKGKK